MDTATEAFVSTVASSVAAVAAVFAIIVAVIALVVARRTLREAGATTQAQRETLGATEAVVAGTGTLVSRIEVSTRILQLTLQESEATREFELLHRIAIQVNALIR